MAVIENEAGPSRPRSTRSSKNEAFVRPTASPSHPTAKSSAPLDDSSRAPAPHAKDAVDLAPVATPPDEETEDDELEEDEDGPEDYEQQRQRRMRENAAIMESLGITALQAARSGTIPSETPRQTVKRRYRKNDAPVFDRSGYIISLPRQGEKHRMACVEIPSDRKLSKKIDDGEYQDCSDWAEGEERRWRFGKGKGKLLEGEEEYVGGVGSDFRWRKWRGRKRELEAEQEKLDELIQKDTRPELPPGVSAYSLIDGPACHQCRRKSDKEKMTCRNIHPVCRAVFCESCCKRYSYFDFDPDARSFICPLCQKCCNCSNCLRKRNLAHLLEGGKGFRRSTNLLREKLGGGDEAEATIQQLLDKVMDHEPLPFDRVRLVEKDTDVISPDLPPIPPTPIARTKARKKGKKRKSALGEDGQPKKKGRPRKSIPEGEMVGSEDAKKGLVIKLRIPKALAPVNDPDPALPTHPPSHAPPSMPPGPVEAARQEEREKMYDSDGDTIAGSSSGGDRSSAGSRSPTPPQLDLPRDLREPAGAKHMPPNSLDYTTPIVPLPQYANNSSMYRPSFGGYRPAVPTIAFPQDSTPTESSIGKLSRPPPAENNNPIFNYQPPSFTSVSNSSTPSFGSRGNTYPDAKQPERWPSGPSQSFSYNSYTYTTSGGDTTTYQTHYAQSSGSANAASTYFQPVPIPSIQSLLSARHVSPSVSPNAQHLRLSNTSYQSPNWLQSQQHQHNEVAPPPYSQSSSIAQPLSLQPVFNPSNFHASHRPEHLDLLSMAASEARNSPSLEAQAQASAHGRGTSAVGSSNSSPAYGYAMLPRQHHANHHYG